MGGDVGLGEGKGWEWGGKGGWDGGQWREVKGLGFGMQG